MAVDILDPTTLAAVRAATDQEAQRAAAVAPWAGGNVTLDYYATSTLLRSVVHGPWVADSATPRGAAVGAYVSGGSTGTAGTPTRVVARSGSTDVLQWTCGVGSGEVSMLAAIGTAGIPQVATARGGSGLKITANASLPTGATPAHILSATEGQWTNIATNTLADVFFDYTGWSVPGYGVAIADIMKTWNGAAYDPARHVLNVKGGGHNGYEGNETYLFDLVAGLWTRLDNPSPYEENTYSGGAGNPLGWDGIYPDNGPQPVHTYGTLCVDPRSGKMYELGKSGSTSLAQIRELDPSVSIQQTPGDQKPWWAYKATISWVDNSHGTSAWMSDEDTFLIGNQDGGTFINFRRYDPVTNVIGAQIDAVAGAFSSVDCSLAYSAARRLAVYHRTDASSNTVVLVDTAANTQALQTITGATLPSRCGLAYDAVRDVFWAYTDEGADRRVLYSINPSTWVATQVSPDGASIDAVAVDYNGIFNRFAYCEDFDVLLAVNSVTGGVYIYKPSGWTAP